MQKGGKNQKWFWIMILLSLLLLMGIGAGVFYAVSAAPRIEAYQALSDAFGGSDSEEEGDSAYTLAFRDDFKATMSFDAAWQNGRVLCEGNAAGESYRFEMGYTARDLWISVPEISDVCYRVSWEDDVVSRMKESSVCALLGLEDSLMEKTGETLISLRKYLLNEDQEELAPSALNRFLGIDGLYVDVLTLYRRIGFSRQGRETLNVEGTDVDCHLYRAEIEDDLMDVLLKSEGISEILRLLSDAVGDTTLTLWINDSGELMKLSADSSFLFTPAFRTGTVIPELGEEAVNALTLEEAPLHVEFIWGAQRSDLEIDVALEGSSFPVTLKLPGHIGDTDTGGWLFESEDASLQIGSFQVQSDCTVQDYDNYAFQAYEPEEELQLWEAGRLRLVLEGLKWVNYLKEKTDGENFD